MIESLTPYEHMKPSGLPWLERIPVGWQILRAKSVFDAIDERSETGAEELLTVSSAKGVIPRASSNVTMFKASSYIGHKLCSPGDLAVNSLWAWAGGLGVSPHRGIINTAYSVYRPKPQFASYARFFHDLLRSPAYRWEFTVRSKGIWTSRLQLSDESFMAMPVLMPPSDEQQAIVNFLKHAALPIDRAISAKRETIGLLNEQKQAIVHRAVTRGLDPSVPLKPSDLPWLEVVPAHWEIRPLRGLIRQRRQRNRSDLPLLTVARERGVFIRNVSDQSENHNFVPEDLSNYKVARSGDLVINKMKAWQGSMGIAPCDGIVSPAYFVFGFGIDNAEYGAALLRSKTYVAQFARMSDGVRVGQWDLDMVALRQLPVLLPPSDEQEAIVDFMDKELRQIDLATSKLEREIRLLIEYRTRLTSDVVTGKLDVREAAKSLPAFDEEPLKLADAPTGDVEDELELAETP